MAFQELGAQIRQLQLRFSGLLDTIRRAAPAGVVSSYAGPTAPDGWLLCDGSTVSRADYPALFVAIGTTYGAGNGSTTFTLPDLAGRVPVGQDPLQTEFNQLGETGGEKTHTLTEAEMPSHSHRMSYQGSTYSTFGLLQSVGAPHSSVGWGAGTQFSPARPIGIVAAGGDKAHNNLQPYLTLQFIIKT